MVLHREKTGLCQHPVLAMRLHAKTRVHPNGLASYEYAPHSWESMTEERRWLRYLKPSVEWWLDES